MNSLITTKIKSGVVAERDTEQEALLQVQVGLPGKLTFYQWRIVLTNITIKEMENGPVIPTLGGDIYRYATGDSPVAISLTGIVLRTPSDSAPKSFRAFYNAHKSAIMQKGTKLMLGKDVYYVLFTNFQWQVSSTSPQVEVIQLGLVGKPA